MPWLRIDENFAEHPKLQRLGLGDRWRFVQLLCWAARNPTDGVVPEGVLMQLWSYDRPARCRRAAGRLYDAGVLHVHTDGWEIHDWADYQPSAESVKREREQAAARMRRYRERERARMAARYGVTAEERYGVTPHPEALRPPSEGFGARAHGRARAREDGAEDVAPPPPASEGGAAASTGGWTGAREMLADHYPHLLPRRPPPV